MSRQNRVNPFGEIHAAPNLGMYMGNRGELHDYNGMIIRPWKINHWIICRTEFRSRSVPLAEPGRYTPLFFLDEATALAAGHRPCATCRRHAYNEFLAAFAEGAVPLQSQSPRLAKSRRWLCQRLCNSLAGGTMRSKTQVCLGVLRA